MGRLEWLREAMYLKRDVKRRLPVQRVDYAALLALFSLSASFLYRAFEAHRSHESVRERWGARRGTTFVRPLLATARSPRLKIARSPSLWPTRRGRILRARLPAIDNGDRPDEDPVRLGSQSQWARAPLCSGRPRRLEFPVKWRSSMAASVREHPGASQASWPLAALRQFVADPQDVQCQSDARF